MVVVMMMSRVLGNWLMESVGVWVVGQAALVQLGLCLCACGCGGSLGFPMFRVGGQVGVFDSHNRR